VDTRTANRKVLESLIKAGAFDFCGEPISKTRAQLTASLDHLLEVYSKFREEQSIGQGSLFDSFSMPQPPASANGNGSHSVPAQEWHEHELLANEKEVLGFYISGHPLAKFKEEIRFYSTHQLGHLPANGSTRIRIAGIIENIRRLTSKQSKAQYGRFKLEDMEGEIDCVVFPKSYAALSNLIHVNAMVVVSGRINRNEQNEDPNSHELIVDDIVPLEKARETLVKSMEIRVSMTALEDPAIEKMKTLLSHHPGKCPVQFVLHTAAHGEFSLDPQLKVKITPELLNALKELLGQGAWKLIPKPMVSSF
jgi:DNA polymerase-3 subunit alpha